MISQATQGGGVVYHACTTRSGKAELAKMVAFPRVTLREPHPSEPVRMSFNHEKNTFTFRSIPTGESLRLPPIVEVIMNMRGMTQEI